MARAGALILALLLVLPPPAMGDCRTECKPSFFFRHRQKCTTVCDEKTTDAGRPASGTSYGPNCLRGKDCTKAGVAFWWTAVLAVAAFVAVGIANSRKAGR